MKIRTFSLIIAISVAIITSCSYFDYYTVKGNYESINIDHRQFYSIDNDDLEIRVAGGISERSVVVFTAYFEKSNYDSICVFPFQIKVSYDMNDYDLVSFYINERRINLEKGDRGYCIEGRKTNKLQLRYSINDIKYEPVPWFEVNLNDFLRIDNDRPIKFDVLRFDKLPQKQ